MAPDDIAIAARLLLEARASHRRLAALPARYVPKTTSDAEAICERMAQGLEQPIGAWKVGCTDPGTPGKYGLERPFCGQVPLQLIYASEARVAHADLMRAVIEPEIVFKLACDLPPCARPYGNEAVRDAIEAMHLGIEIPESRLVDDHPHGALGMVADQGYAGRLVVGPQVDHWQTLDLPSQAVMVSVNGRCVATGRAARAMGSPLTALVWLANDRATRGEGLKAGQYISTGSLTGIIPIHPGSSVIADYGTLGR